MSYKVSVLFFKSTKYERRIYYKDDCLSIIHREDGPAVEWKSGEKEWFLNNKRHREDGPAIERENGTKEWWVNNKRHREDGPAIEYRNGEKEYYLNDVKYTKEYYFAKIRLGEFV